MPAIARQRAAGPGREADLREGDAGHLPSGGAPSGTVACARPPRARPPRAESGRNSGQRTRNGGRCGYCRDVDWSLFGCARRGHLTYEPDEPELRERLMAPTAAGPAWRCLRCGAFVTGEPHGSGPAAAAPLPRRGRELRSELILRVFAVERFLRFLVFAAASYGVWRFKYDRAGIQRAFDSDLPAIRALYRDLGFNVSHSRLLGLIQHSFTLDSRTLTYLAAGLAGYALIELVEGIGLWLGRRWGEYFAMVATSVFLPYEIYDLTVKVTWLRLVALVINLLLVIYLVWTKRLFGVRGGGRAYEARLRTESVIAVEQAALRSRATRG